MSRAYVKILCQDRTCGAGHVAGPGGRGAGRRDPGCGDDAASARRFRRYWRFVGPFSELIRCTALGMLARELDPAARNGGEIVIARPAETVFDAVADERTEPRYNPQVRNVELLTPCRAPRWRRTSASP